MGLSNNVVSEFVKMTNDSSTKKKDQSKIYGTVVLYGEEGNQTQYVQLDGSDLLTPADSTVHIKNGERVTVSINNHQAIIDGNVTDISASDEELKEVHNELVDFKITTEGMFLEIRDEFNTKFTEFKVTVDGMFLEVRNEMDQKFTDFQVTVDGMFLEVRNEMDQKFTNFEVTVDGMFLDVRNEMDQKFAQVKVTTDAITAEVSKKVDGTQVGTIVTQNAESWNLSINGKLKGTYYNFDGNSFTIGGSSGTTTAYHTPSYSKWTHTDGSWTQVSASGMTWSKGSTTSGYHCLLYAGEYTCNSEQTVTVTLPSEFKGKPFKVVTSVKRIYVSKEEYATGCYFPLISFYAEALNVNHSAGTFQVYASIRAWNRTSYGGWGTLIGNGTTAGEREALKPVVAYWAFV